jgi:hypothetical protein
MKNIFIATFMLLVAGLVFNDVASVWAKSTKRNPNGWKKWQIQQVNIEGTNAIYRCYGTMSKYREPQQCNKADRIKGALANGCDAADPIACKLLSNMIQVEAAANFAEAGENAKELAGD